MQVETRHEGDVVIVELSGRLLIGEPTVALRDTVDELLAAGRRKIVLDVSDLARIDSSGVGELVACLKTARAAGARLVLLQVKDRVRRILDLSQVLPLFESYDGEDAALAALR